CLSTRVKRLRVDNFCQDEGTIQCKNIVKFLNGIKINEINIVDDTISDKKAAYFLELMDCCRIEKCYLSIIDCRLFNPVQFLLDLACRCKAIHLFQLPNFSVAPKNSAYLFG
ncbi:hypothetical protein PFISCL1PPCAC_9453, partial [Pristionchus fissidentatus]